MSVSENKKFNLNHRPTTFLRTVYASHLQNGLLLRIEMMKQIERGKWNGNIAKFSRARNSRGCGSSEAGSLQQCLKSCPTNPSRFIWLRKLNKKNCFRFSQIRTTACGDVEIINRYWNIMPNIEKITNMWHTHQRFYFLFPGLQRKRLSIITFRWANDYKWSKWTLELSWLYTTHATTWIHEFRFMSSPRRKQEIKSMRNYLTSERSGSSLKFIK